MKTVVFSQLINPWKPNARMSIGNQAFRGRGIRSGASLAISYYQQDF
jgi:hypothetical protein